MIPVRGIPLILLLILAVGACSSSPDSEDLPPIVPASSGSTDPVGVQPERPDGYIGDPVNKYFHRLDCPRAKDVKPSVRRFYLTPYDALNAGLTPCEYCEPMAGLK